MSTNHLNSDTLIGTFGKNWPTAFGIGYAESHGEANAVGPGGADAPVGIFQIKPSTAKANGLDPTRLKDPAYNIHAAGIISKHGTDWRQWSTAYEERNGIAIPGTYLSPKAAFRQYLTHSGLSAGQTAGTPDPIGNIFGLPSVKNPVPDPPLPHIGNPLKWGDALSKVLSNLLDPSWWLRVGKILGGVALLLFGLTHIARGTDTGRSVSSAAKKVAEVAAV